ncbi:hypothetical protein CGCSCA5_v006274 [Colletotrichum siamense]|nr:hypothetical protein CGCSCA5_v006274 [Colletotrichum siamense]KAF4878197.1 hypothetical protein CGCSCA1_v002991 [Colletotrichum siamense]
MLAAAVSLLIQRANSKRLDWTLDRRSQEARYLTQKQNILAPFIRKPDTKASRSGRYILSCSSPTSCHNLRHRNFLLFLTLFPPPLYASCLATASPAFDFRLLPSPHP